MDYANIATAFANNKLSPASVPPASFAHLGESALFRNPLMLKASLNDAETALARVRGEIADREAKIDHLRAAAEGYAGVTAIISFAATHELNDTLQRLAAETAARDRLLLAVRGIERFIAWRKQEDAKSGQRAA